MILKYTPEDGEPQSWEFHPKKLRAVEAELLERRTGLTWDEFASKVQQGYIPARRALLWLFQWRQHPKLRYEDVDYQMDELELSYERHELVAMREQIVNAKGPTEQEREIALAQIDDQIAGLDGPDEAPKAPES